MRVVGNMMIISCIVFEDSEKFKREEEQTVIK